MKITFEFPDTHLQGKDQEHLKGLIVSFLGILDDILLRRRKVTVLSHFYQERLNKNERRLLQIFFEKNIERLSKRKPKTENVSESSDLGVSGIPEEFREVLEFFQSIVVSTRATKSSSVPNAGETTKRTGGIHNEV